MTPIFRGCVIAALLAAAPSAARADMLPDPGYLCRSKSRGDACSVAGKPGWCSPGVCETYDDSKEEAKTVECLVCETERPQPKVPEAGSDSTVKGCTVGAPVPVGLGIVFFGCAVWLRRRR